MFFSFNSSFQIHFSQGLQNKLFLPWRLLQLIRISYSPIISSILERLNGPRVLNLKNVLCKVEVCSSFYEIFITCTIVPWHEEIIFPSLQHANVFAASAYRIQQKSWWLLYPRILQKKKNEFVGRHSHLGLFDARSLGNNPLFKWFTLQLNIAK